MAHDSERRRHPRTRVLLGQRDLTIIYQVGIGRNMMIAKLLDFGEEGLSDEIKSRLPEGSLVEIAGEMECAGGHSNCHSHLPIEGQFRALRPSGEGKLAPRVVRSSTECRKPD